MYKMSIKNKIKKRTKKTKKNNMYGGSSATTPPTTPTTLNLSVKSLLESGKYGLVKGKDGQLALRHTDGHEIPVAKVNISSALSTAMVKVIHNAQFTHMNDLLQHQPRARISNLPKSLGIFPALGIAPQVHARSLINTLVNKGAQNLLNSSKHNNKERGQQTLNSHYRLGKLASETIGNVGKGAAGAFYVGLGKGLKKVVVTGLNGLGKGFKKIGNGLGLTKKGVHQHTLT